jgi:hypothetical protein
MLRPRATRPPRGLTLIESLLASALLAAVVVSVSWPFTAAGHHERAAARRIMASQLGAELMEEIIAQPFDDPDGNSAAGPDSGEFTRQDFDNIDDYHGYAEPAGQLRDIDGQLIAGEDLVGLSREAAAEYVWVQGQSPGDPPSFIAVAVTVKYRGGAIATLKRLVYDVQ